MFVASYMNVIASPKAGKSWLATGLAMQVVTGGVWLNTFECTKGRVLLIDGELHQETLAHRLPIVATEMGVPEEDFLDSIDVWALRGCGMDLFRLGDAIRRLDASSYSLIILDASYRFLPAGISENDNAAVMTLYNTIDGYADRLDAAWVNIHHASKGDQSGKTTTDVGSGAGSQSRAADTHIAIRPHEDEGVAVLNAVVRSWPPAPQLAIRWQYPAWTLAEDVDPRKLRKPQTARQLQQRADDEMGISKVIAALAGKTIATARELRAITGLSKDRLQRLLDRLQSEKRLIATEIKKRGQVCDQYQLAPPSDLVDD